MRAETVRRSVGREAGKGPSSSPIARPLMALTTLRAALRLRVPTTHRSGWPLQPSQLDAALGGVVPWRVLDPALLIGDPTYADAILDRLVHNAHRIELAGESMRRTRGKQNQKA